MAMTDYFDLEYAKNELNRFLENKSEPELCIRIEVKDYMIIPLRDKISFQWISHTEEKYYKTVDELFETELVNGIILNRDWKTIEDIWFC